MEWSQLLSVSDLTVSSNIAPDVLSTDSTVPLRLSLVYTLYRPINQLLYTVCHTFSPHPLHKVSAPPPEGIPQIGEDLDGSNPFELALPTDMSCKMAKSKRSHAIVKSEKREVTPVAVVQMTCPACMSMQIATSANAQLFQLGGILDSQTTDLQFVRELDNCPLPDTDYATCVSLISDSKSGLYHINNGSQLVCIDIDDETTVGTLDNTFDIIVTTLSVLQGRVRDLEYEIARKNARHKQQVQELLSLKEFLQTRTDKLSCERDLAQHYCSNWAQLELHCQALED
ncbi:hypothetical protein PHLCEN_2v9666 [Hermanssonia centrifuga]|uniref:Uncharacterized protein n=1 Tax=Hermanssonia centrifuga TaxID=98765 RepID=A0A2R6NQW6_9APHY|nr:hypothetical protein PHLCEN_2v9666 [Hermanssonia centrifuga]